MTDIKTDLLKNDTHGHKEWAANRVLHETRKGRIQDASELTDAELGAQYREWLLYAEQASHSFSFRTNLLDVILAFMVVVGFIGLTAWYLA